MLLCVEAAIESVRRHPKAHAAAESDIGRALVRGFSHSVFFLIEPSEIVVIGIFPAARDPRAWQARR